MNTLCALSKPAAMVLLAVAAAGWQPVSAQAVRSEPAGFTWGELALLPEYCKDTQGTVYGGPAGGTPSPRSPQWLALMGEDFWHMHHYCYGLRNLIRVEGPNLSPMQRKALLERAVLEFMYIVNNCKSTMVLMPEVFYRIGDVQLRLGKVGEALGSLEQARRLKPDYWPAYTRWIDVLLESRQFEAAAALAQEGLGHMPDQPELTKRLQAAQRRTPAAAATAQAPKAKPPTP
jgi:tetratricopeptide (TPR) repeat protein